jgi:hypothetical protein
LQEIGKKQSRKHAKSAGRGIRTPEAPRGHKLLGALCGISRLAPYLARRPRHREPSSVMLLQQRSLLQVVVECKVSAICVFCKHRLNSLL